MNDDHIEVEKKELSASLFLITEHIESLKKDVSNKEEYITCQQDELYQMMKKLAYFKQKLQIDSISAEENTLYGSSQSTLTHNHYGQIQEQARNPSIVHSISSNLKDRSSPIIPVLNTKSTQFKSLSSSRTKSKRSGDFCIPWNRDSVNISQNPTILIV